MTDKFCKQRMPHRPLLPWQYHKAGSAAHRRGALGYLGFRQVKAVGRETKIGFQGVSVACGKKGCVALPGRGYYPALLFICFSLEYRGCRVLVWAMGKAMGAGTGL